MCREQTPFAASLYFDNSCVCVRQEEDRRSPPPTHMLHAFLRLCHVVWRFLPSHVNKYSEPGILRSLAFRVQGVLRAFVVATEISGRSGRKLGAREKNVCSHEDRPVGINGCVCVWSGAL